MSHSNAGWLFYRGYYRESILNQHNEITFTHPYDFEKVNEKIFQTKLITLPITNGTHRFVLTTIYPGLLSGSGYTHEAKITNEEAYPEQLINQDYYKNRKIKDTKTDYNDALKIGFYFDSATGMPVIPGSQVKGMLRSYFPQRYKANSMMEQNKNEYLITADERELFLIWFMNDYCGFDLPNEFNISLLENEIFERVKDGAAKKIYTCDIFHDAVPISVSPNFRESSGQQVERLFGSDYITPHKHDTRPELDPFTDPKPIKFLKVMPGVTFEFRFKLNNGLLTAGQKKTLFEKLLLWGGIGAKTNVGYGQFSSPSANNTPQEPPELSTFTGQIKDKALLFCQVIQGNEIKAIINGVEEKYKLVGITNPPSAGTIIQVKMNVVGKRPNLRIQDMTYVKNA